jgi:hypothetical protein
MAAGINEDEPSDQAKYFRSVGRCLDPKRDECNEQKTQVMGPRDRTGNCRRASDYCGNGKEIVFPRRS